MDRGSLSGAELLVLVVGGFALVIAGVVWSGAAVSALIVGGRFTASLGDAFGALAALPGHLGDPAAAWLPDAAASLPGPGLYWLCTAMCAVAAAAVVAIGLRWWGRSRVGTALRRPLGVDARARFARPRDLGTLIVKRPMPGRFILGRVGRHLVATESRSAASSPRRVGKRGRRQRMGDRGAVALVGPSRSGKTTAVVSGVLEWDGPAVLSSVKDDLLRVTTGWRAEKGEIAVFGLRLLSNIWQLLSSLRLTSV